MHPVRLLEYLRQRRIRLRRRTPIKEYRILNVFLIYFEILRFVDRFSLFIFTRALSSAGSERTPHTRKVVGSIPTAPTRDFGLRIICPNLDLSSQFPEFSSDVNAFAVPCSSEGTFSISRHSDGMVNSDSSPSEPAVTRCASWLNSVSSPTWRRH